MFKRSGVRIRSLISAVVVAVMIAGGLVGPIDVAAQNQTVQSQLTGVNISYGSQYELQPDSTFEPDTLEFMMFLGPADILAVGFMSPLIDLNGARDLLLEGFFGEGIVSANIDRGSYTGVSYSLDMINLDGSEMGIFTLFMNQRAHGFSEFYVFLAPPAYFGTAMQSAQNSFTIDGNPLMDGVDPTVMGDMVVANIGLTGGTAVTDVDEVTDQADTSETTDTIETTTTQTDASSKADYLASVQAEYDQANTDLANFLMALKDLSEKTIDAGKARSIADTSMTSLAGASDRAAAIQPPAGMESFHQEYLEWAQAMTKIGNAWTAFVNQTGTSDQHSAALTEGIEINTSFGKSLDAELAADVSESDDADDTTDSSGDSGTSRTSRTTRTSDTAETPEATETSGTSRTTRTTRGSDGSSTGSNSEGSTTRTTTTTRSTSDSKANSSETNSGNAADDERTEYLEAVRAEYDLVDEQIVIITDALVALGEDEITADEAFSLITEANGVLVSSGTRIQGLEAPAGMEDFHEEFLEWSDSAVNTGTVWAEFMAQTVEASDYTDALFDLIDLSDTFGDSLDAEESASDFDVKSFGIVGKEVLAA